MAFDRDVILEIGKGGTGLLISDLDISFSIKRTVGNEPNTATFTIYNTKEETRNKILTKDNNVVFKAGHKDEKNTAIIFTGTIIKSSTQKEGNTYVTIIDCLDYGNNKQGFAYNTYSLSYIEKTPLSTIIQDLSASLSVPVIGLENVKTVLNNSFNFSGTLSGLLRKIRNVLEVENIILWFDNNEMILYNKDSTSTFEVNRLTLESGLISINEVIEQDKTDNKKRIEVLSILNPKFRPRSALNVEGFFKKGTYIIESIEFFGDNIGGDFNCRMECVE